LGYIDYIEVLNFDLLFPEIATMKRIQRYQGYDCLFHTRLGHWVACYPDTPSYRNFEFSAPSFEALQQAIGTNTAYSAPDPWELPRAARRRPVEEVSAA
jgi:hypothetical protein